MFNILFENYRIFLGGLFVTLKLFILIILIGIIFGVLFGIIGGRYSLFLNKCIVGLKFFTKVVPVLVLLFWFHFPFQALLQVVVDPFWTAVGTLSFINIITIAHYVQNELSLLPQRYYEAGLSLGMSKKHIIQYIEIPILFRRIIPEVMLTQATMLEYTLFASLISVPELFRVAQTVNAMVYDPIAVYSLLIVFFILILGPIHLFIYFFTKKKSLIYV